MQISHFKSIKYGVKEEAFFTELKRRVEDYFSNQGISKYANLPMYGKALFQLILLFGIYGMIMTNRFEGISLILLFIAFHFSIFLVSVGIAHDGSHYAYSAKKWVNRLMTQAFDLIGINSYVWGFNHIKSHHNVPNVPNYDSAIDSFVLFRFHPKARHYSFHRYQHWYIIIIYAFATLFKIFFLDYYSFGRKQIGYLKIEKHAPREILWLITTKLIVIGYSLLIPLLFLDAPVWQILLGFLLGNFVAGISLGIIFQVTHLSDRTQWPEVSENGQIDNSFALHIFETTADFATDSFITNWISGGLNHHVAHHLFPSISQIHLPAITKIVQDVAKKYNLPYKAYPSTFSAIKSHLYTLKKLGEKNSQMPLHNSLQNA